MFCHVYFYPASELNLRFSHFHDDRVLESSYRYRGFICHSIRKYQSFSSFCLEFYNTSLDTAEQEHAATSFLIFNQFNLQTVHLVKSFNLCQLFATLFPSAIVVLPCHHLCSTVQSSCIHLFNTHGVPWPSRLNCSHLPPSPQLCL